MKIDYRLANIDDIDQLVRLRTLMQFEVNQLPDRNVPGNFTQKVKTYFLTSISQKKYYCSVAVFENQIIANAGAVFYEKPPTIYGRILRKKEMIFPLQPMQAFSLNVL